MAKIEAVVVGEAEIGPDKPVFVIAEAGVNHNGDPELAARLVDAAADAGADAVKFQTFGADDLVAADAPKAAYQEQRTGSDETQHEMLRALELSEAVWQRLVARCSERAIAFLSTPFDSESVDLLVRLGAPALKIASPDLTNPLLLERAAATRLPLIVSTGMGTESEVADALDVLRHAGAGEVVLLHCVSAYPAPVEEANLLAIPAMADRFGVPIGYSDHTLGSEAAIAAVALGACVIEKHLTLDRSLPGPDHAVSLEPADLTELVGAIRRVEQARGDGVKRPMPSEAANVAVVRRSLAAARDLPAGAEIDRSVLTALRPGTGMPPSRIDDVIGKTLVREVRRGELLDSAMFE